MKFTRRARKHKIGKAHALAAMSSCGEPEFVAGKDGYDDQLVWIGVDDRGVELEIVAVILPDFLLVIHVMPTQFRRRSL
ncbi:hypothetical protein BJF85_05505 [Saccharomonospora sp. CUA-673]|uniref:hypothetical protein n=1 Tax=Saccharomonospora sp. CUA-673 TaxID=1904969 RepID=UPI000967FDBE|nr:hypothetical protein [Saccharomonospora sp. CUA-673]OLT40608.1 hypothetical protein BJF85_05505 [Saccharomonospora sp. CUA-673]